MDINKILESQRQFFQSGATLSVKFRIEMLKKLYHTVNLHAKKMFIHHFLSLPQEAIKNLHHMEIP